MTADNIDVSTLGHPAFIPVAKDDRGEDFTNHMPHDVFCLLFGEKGDRLQGLSPEVTEDLYQQIRVFVECLQIRVDRHRRYGDTWKRRGYQGVALKLDDKVERLVAQFYERDPEDHGPELLDDAYDVINYAAMFIQLVKQDNRTGRK